MYRRGEDVDVSVAKRQRTNRLQPEGDIIEVVEVDKGKSLAGETSSAPVWAPPFLKPDRTPITKVDSLLESLELALLLLGGWPSPRIWRSCP